MSATRTAVLPSPGPGDPPAPAGPFFALMPVVCAWCGVTIDLKPATRADESGGICRNCLEEKLEELRAR